MNNNNMVNQKRLEELTQEGAVLTLKQFHELRVNYCEHEMQGSFGRGYEFASTKDRNIACDIHALVDSENYLRGFQVSNSRPIQ